MFFQKSIVCSQAAFSAMAAVVRAVSAHLSHRNDSHGRNALLMTYIAYQVLTSLKSFNYWSFARLICLTWIRPSLITNMVQGADNASTGKHLQKFLTCFPSGRSPARWQTTTRSGRSSRRPGAGSTMQGLVSTDFPVLKQGSTGPVSSQRVMSPIKR